MSWADLILVAYRGLLYTCFSTGTSTVEAWLYQTITIQFENERTTNLVSAMLLL